MTKKSTGSALVALYDAANAALNDADKDYADGIGLPEWAEPLRAAFAELCPPDATPDEEPWQKLIRLYAEEIGPTPEPEQALILKLFREAGRQLPIWEGTCHEMFHAQFRKLDIFPDPCESKEIIVWFLLHLDTAFHHVAIKMWPHQSDIPPNSLRYN